MESDEDGAGPSPLGRFLPSGAYERKREGQALLAQKALQDGERVSLLYRSALSTAPSPKEPPRPKPNPTRKRRPLSTPLPSSSSSSSATPSSSSSPSSPSSLPPASPAARPAPAAPAAPEDPKAFFCEVCQKEVKGLERREHAHLTPHQIEIGRQLAPPSPSSSSSAPLASLHLDRTNIGFRMLESQGWQADQGLGRDNQGRREPVKTEPKNDKLGVGIAKPKDRPKDGSKDGRPPGAREEEKPRRLTSAQRKRKEVEERVWRQEMLRYLST